MEIDVTLQRDEVLELLAEVAPPHIHLTEGDEDRRHVELEPPSGGLSITCSRRRPTDDGGVASQGGSTPRSPARAGEP